MTAKLEVLKRIADAALARAIHEAAFGTPEGVDTWTSVAIYYAQAVERDTPANAVNTEDRAGVYRMAYAGGYKLDLIKRVRAEFDLGLKEAKDFVEGELTVFWGHASVMSLLMVGGVTLTRVN